jgi:hypothetical protein
MTAAPAVALAAAINREHEAGLPVPVAADVLAEAEGARLRDRLVYATNQQRRPATQDDGADWTTIELWPALPSPDRDLAERIARVIDASGLDPLTVQETLNKVYCDHQNQHRLLSPYGPPVDLPQEAAA